MERGLSLNAYTLYILVSIFYVFMNSLSFPSLLQKNLVSGPKIARRVNLLGFGFVLLAFIIFSIILWLNKIYKTLRNYRDSFNTSFVYFSIFVI